MYSPVIVSCEISRPSAMECFLQCILLISALVLLDQTSARQAGQVSGDIQDWISGFGWSKVGRDVCQCEMYKSQSFCENSRKKSQIDCMEARRGSKLLVKRYGLEAEVQAMYDPTPSRGISFVR